MKIAVFGLGYVGATAACCLASEGHTVLGVDVSEKKVNQINAGKIPIVEPGLQTLLTQAHSAKLISATTIISDALAEVDLAIVCVGTPSAADGSHNMGYIAEVTRQIASHVNSERHTPLTVAYRSTVRPGTIDHLVIPIFQQVLGDNYRSFVEIVYNPEFLRESSAIKDFFDPPKIVVGTFDGQPSKNMEAIHGHLKAPTFNVGYREAEITKFVDNTWHATKVAFANEVGRICALLDISAAKVHEIFVSDTKLNISPYYMRPGGAFGGSCLPKDVRAFQYISAEVGANTHLIDSLVRSNTAHKQFHFEQIRELLPTGGSVLMLGIAFKANTDDLRESPNVDLARKLLQAGYKLDVFDPHVDASNLVGQNLGYAYTHLPEASHLLLSREAIEAKTYDLAVLTNNSAFDIQVTAKNTVNINAIS